MELNIRINDNSHTSHFAGDGVHYSFFFKYFNYFFYVSLTYWCHVGFAAVGKFYSTTMALSWFR